MLKQKSLSIKSGKKKKTNFIRPNSSTASKRYYTIRTNNSQYDQFPPINFPLPTNKNLTSGMGNNIEREQLYENNMQLKEDINKLRRELAETKYHVSKKDNELREKEKIIRDCLKENDILNNQILKLKVLYEDCKNNLKKYQNVVQDLNNFKEKFVEQHSIISSYVKKCEVLNAEISNLKGERDSLIRELENNKKKQEKLRISYEKLRIKHLQFLNQKKIKEQKDLKNTDNEKDLQKYKKHAYEFKKAFNQKLVDYTELKKTCDLYQKKLDSYDERLLKPFQYQNIKHIEKENNPKNIDKIELYKSLFDESQIIISIYEKYLKEININPKDILRKYGYTGLLNTENNVLLVKGRDNLIENKINKENENNKINIQNNNGNKTTQNNEKIYPLENKILNSNSNNNNIKKPNNNQNDNANEDNDNVSNTNTNIYSKANPMNNNYNNNNLNNVEDYNIEEEDENKYLNIFHIILKNLEANHITKEMINEKMYKIFESFEGKSEASKEDFILPFYNLMVESMKISLEEDKQFIRTFFDNYIDTIKGNTNVFFNELYEIFQNLVDYSNLSNNGELLNALSLNLKKYKNDLEKRFKEDDKEGTYIINFDIFKNIVNDINIPLTDELMEFLIYKMKSSVPENHSIFDLNYKIIPELLNREINNDIEEDNEAEELSKKISDTLSNFKNNMIKDKTDLEKVCKSYIKKFAAEEKDFEVIGKDEFFEIMEKYGVTANEDIKDTIYKLFINEEQICTNNGKNMMMDFKKLRNLFLNDYYSEEN